MIFHEIYGSYYRTVAEVLREAVQDRLTQERLWDIVREKGFRESAVTIPEALTRGKWPLLRKDLSTPIKHEPTTPLSDIQKMWMKALLQDPRIRLFSPSAEGLEEVPPLFEADFFVYYDRCSDGDPFGDPEYGEHFRLLLLALREKRRVRVRYDGKRGGLRKTLTPEKMEYSSKDDKFRFTGYSEGGTFYTVNVARVKRVELMERAGPEAVAPAWRCGQVTLELWDDRNALERAMLHFSDLEKETVRLDEERYRITLTYRQEDETEILIRILSFGPMLKVTGPEHFVGLIRERLRRQKSCGR